MGNKYLLGFDAGTSASKGTICDIKGNIIATAERFHSVTSPQPGFAEHDPIKDWWDEFVSIVAELKEKGNVAAEDIVGVGISTIMAGIVPVDEEGNPLRNAILYGIDSRSTKQVQDLNREIGEETLMRTTECMVDNESFGPRIRWIADNEPEIFARAKCFTMDAGFLVHKLTGMHCVDRYSARSAIPMYDNKTLDWSEETTPYVCRIDQLPKIMNTTDIAGCVTREAAALCGLAEGTPVIVGTTDAGAEAVSGGVLDPGDMMLMYGSTMYIIRLTEKQVDGSEMGNGAYVLPGVSRLTGGMATTGSLLRWVRDELSKDLVKEEKEGGPNAYTVLSEEAASIEPGANGLIVLPYFQGERMPLKDPKAKGVMFGLTLNHTRAHIVRAAYEGVGYGVDQVIDLLRKDGLAPERLIAVGGGTKSLTWLQIVSDICGLEQIVPETTIGASYGNALLAGVGIGALTVSDIRSMIKLRTTVKPNWENHEKYKKYKKHFKELYERNQDIMHDLWD